MSKWERLWNERSVLYGKDGRYYCHVCGEETDALPDEDGWRYCSLKCIKIDDIEDRMNDLYRRAVGHTSDVRRENEKLEKRIELLEYEIRSIKFLLKE